MFISIDYTQCGSIYCKIREAYKELTSNARHLCEKRLVRNCENSSKTLFSRMES